MASTRLVSAVKEKPAIAAVAAAGIFFLLPLIQTVNTPLAFDIWFLDLQQKPWSSIPYIAFSVLFGMFIALYLYTRNKCLDCKPERARTGFAGSIVGFMVGVCPACFSFIGVLLPLGPTLFLTSYSPVFTGVSIAIVLFSIYKLGGFKRQVAPGMFRRNPGEK
jgi:membrane protease YdiL (CAAX protease family)